MNVSMFLFDMHFFQLVVIFSGFYSLFIIALDQG